jgi:hypothetical protein
MRSNDIEFSGERKRVRCNEGLDAGFWYAEVLADFGREKLVDLAMPRNRGHLALRPVDVHGVRAAFTKKLTAMPFEMTN